MLVLGYVTLYSGKTAVSLTDDVLSDMDFCSFFLSYSADLRRAIVNIDNSWRSKVSMDVCVSIDNYVF